MSQTKSFWDKNYDKLNNPKYLEFKSLFEKGDYIQLEKDFAKYQNVWSTIVDEKPYFFNLVRINVEKNNRNFHEISPTFPEVIEVKDEQIKFIFTLIKLTQEDTSYD